MYFAYFDESGDPNPNANSPTNYFVLACVIVHERQWVATLDALQELRRSLRKRLGIPFREELKAGHIINGHGALASVKISQAERQDLYREVLQYQASKLEIKTFAVAVHKAPTVAKGWVPFETAWKFEFQRFQTFCDRAGECGKVIHDQGHTAAIRSLLRRMRRFSPVPSFYGSDALKCPTAQIIEDADSRDSRESLLTQVADWNALAAHRSQYVDPAGRVPDDLWDILGDTRLLAINGLSGGPPGIKMYPQK